MPRPHDTERYELSDTEKRDLISLIEKGKPLPDRYRFLLFEDKREVERSEMEDSVGLTRGHPLPDP